MSLEVKYIKARGTQEERIVFVAKTNLDIGKYLVFTSKQLEGDQFSSSIKQPFWFPDKLVNKGDLIVLYTKVGSTSVKDNSEGTKSHFYYRNLSNPIFTDDKTIGILIESLDWNPIK